MVSFRRTAEPDDWHDCDGEQESQREYEYDMPATGRPARLVFPILIVLVPVFLNLVRLTAEAIYTKSGPSS